MSASHLPPSTPPSAGPSLSNPVHHNCRRRDEIGCGRGQKNGCTVQFVSRSQAAGGCLVADFVTQRPVQECPVQVGLVPAGQECVDLNYESLYRTHHTLMTTQPGTYALVLNSQSRQNIQIGRWRKIEIQPGYYVYIGSAFGPGGVRARVARHFRTDKKQHWHIDYLRAQLTPLGVWVSYAPVRLEHLWARTLAGKNDFRPVAGFGCSDCSCHSHLFLTDELWNMTLLLGETDGTIDWWPYQNHAPGE